MKQRNLTGYYYHKKTIFGMVLYVEVVERVYDGLEYQDVYSIVRARNTEVSLVIEKTTVCYGV